MRGRLFNNIILIGGNSLFAGYQRRLFAFFLILFSKFIISKLKFILLRNIIRFSAKRYKLIKKKEYQLEIFFLDYIFIVLFLSFLEKFLINYFSVAWNCVLTLMIYIT